MKHFISPEQYNELSDQAKQKFIVWHLTQPVPAPAYRGIGHLIQFLDEHLTGGWKIERMTSWQIRDEEHHGFEEREYPELVDALWDAVKKILEGKQP